LQCRCAAGLSFGFSVLFEKIYTVYILIYNPDSTRRDISR
jgi:hypothetical protein